MGHGFPALQTSDRAAAPAAEVGTQAWIELQLLIVAQLTWCGGRLAEQIAAAIEAWAKDGPVRFLCRLSDAFDRVARAVRMAIALERRLVAELDRLRRGGAPTMTEAAAKDERSNAGAAAQAQAARGDVLERGEEAPEGARPIQAEEAERPQGVRLPGLRSERDDAWNRAMSRPVLEVIAEICRNLGLPADWLRQAEAAGLRPEADGDDPEVMARSPLVAWMVRASEAFKLLAGPGPAARAGPPALNPCAASP